MNKTSRNSSRTLTLNDSKHDVILFQTDQKNRLLEKLRTESKNLSIILSFPSQIQKINELEQQIEEIQEKCLVEEQYTKVLLNMEKRITASNKEYKIKVESLQRKEQTMLNKLNKGKEVIYEAVSNNKEDQHKVGYMRSSLTAMRSFRKHEIDKHLLLAQRSANQIYNSCRFNDNPINSITEEETRAAEVNKEILKKLVRVSLTTEMRKKEIDENLTNLTNLFKTLGMPDLNECLIEYEKVVITNESLSRKTDVLLKEITQIEKKIEELSKHENLENKEIKVTEIKPRAMKRNRSKIGETEVFYSSLYLFKDLDMKIKRILNVTNNESKNESKTMNELINDLVDHFLNLENKLKQEVNINKELQEEIDFNNGHVYKKPYNPLTKSIQSIDPDLMYSDKHTYIADLQESALQVEREAKKIIKSLKSKPKRETTPLVNTENNEPDFTPASGEVEKTKTFDLQTENLLSPAFMERNFDKNIKRVSSQNLLFRKKKSSNLKNAKFYCQDMLIKQKKWSQTPKKNLTQGNFFPSSVIKKIRMFSPKSMQAATPKARMNIKRQLLRML